MDATTARRASTATDRALSPGSLVGMPLCLPLMVRTHPPPTILGLPITTVAALAIWPVVLLGITLSLVRVAACREPDSYLPSTGWSGAILDLWTPMVTRIVAVQTLQLLPGTERRSYAGAVVDVLEGLDGQLAVRYRGEIIPSQEAPPRAGILRSFNGSSSHGTPPRPDLNGLSRRWEAALAALDAQMDAGDADEPAIDNGAVSPQGTCHAAQEAHSTSDGKVERCSEGEAQGVVDSRGRPRTRHPSGHGKEVHGSSEPAHEARPGRIGAICYHREQYK